jgi:hypothetical protein
MRRHCMKFSPHGDLVPGICATVLCVTIDVKERQTANIVINCLSKEYISCSPSVTV